MNLKRKYGNYELHPKMKITGYENEIWDEKKEIIEELKRAVQEKQKEKKTCILSFDLYPGVRKEEMMELANALQPDRIFDIEVNQPLQELKNFFPEFHPYEGKCRFLGCIHGKEPGCAVKEALEQGNISKERFENYTMFYEELKEQEKRRY